MNAEPPALAKKQRLLATNPIAEGTFRACLWEMYQQRLGIQGANAECLKRLDWQFSPGTYTQGADAYLSPAGRATDTPSYEVTNDMAERNHSIHQIRPLPDVATQFARVVRVAGDGSGHRLDRRVVWFLAGSFSSDSATRTS